MLPRSYTVNREAAQGKQSALKKFNDWLDARYDAAVDLFH